MNSNLLLHQKDSSSGRGSRGSCALAGLNSDTYSVSTLSNDITYKDKNIFILKK